MSRSAGRLIIYAARNQYNHWDDENAHEMTEKVFGVLSSAFSLDPLSDLGFELSNPSITVFASEVLLVALGWRTYDRYLLEMRSLLGSATTA